MPEVKLPENQCVIWGCKTQGEGRVCCAHFYETAQSERRRRLKDEVARVFRVHRGKYGAQRIAADLRDAGWQVSKNTVTTMLQELDLRARPGRPRGYSPKRKAHAA